MHKGDIPIPTTCPADWDAMKPPRLRSGEKPPRLRSGENAGTNKRWCETCEKHVHDLSSMTSDQARALLTSPATEGLCVRYLCDTSGAVVFRREAEPPRLIAPGRLARVKRYVGAAAALALPMSLTACMGTYVPHQPPPVPALVPSTSASAAAPIPEKHEEAAEKKSEVASDPASH